MLYGLDVGGTKIELAIYDNALNQKTAWRAPTPGQNYQDFLEAIVEMIMVADESTGAHGSVGIGLPGYVNEKGAAVSANVECINGKQLGLDIVNRLGRPVALQNDMNMFALSEANCGAGKGYKHVMGLIMGTGLGAGLCVNGEIYLGKSQAGRECGHVQIPAILQQRFGFALRACGCGLAGCQEQYLAGPGLLWMSSHFGCEYSSVSGLMDGYRMGEEKAAKTFSAYIDCLGCYFAQLILMYDPDVIVLGGGLSNIAEIYQQLPAAIGPYLFEGVTLPVIAPPMYGDSSGVRGAALLGKRNTVVSSSGVFL